MKKLDKIIKDIEKELFSELDLINNYYLSNSIVKDYFDSKKKNILFQKLNENNDSSIGLHLTLYYAQNFDISDYEITELINLHESKFGESYQTLEPTLKKIKSLKEIFLDLKQLHQQNLSNENFEPCDSQTMIDLIDENLSGFSDYSLSYEFDCLNFYRDHYLSLSVSKKNKDSDTFSGYRALKSKLTNYNETYQIILRQAWESLDDVIKKVEEDQKYSFRRLKKEFGQSWLAQTQVLMQQKYNPKEDILN